MFAIIKTGGKQYIVSPGDKIKVEKLEISEGEEVVFDDVLLFSDKETQVGDPYVKGYVVKGKVLAQGRGKKIIVFKYKPKKRYHKKQGHRQAYTEVEITGIGPKEKPTSSKAIARRNVAKKPTGTVAAKVSPTRKSAGIQKEASAKKGKPAK